jgi:ubiquinone/menaquinone biosynthesis C-methylase UbiE
MQTAVSLPARLREPSGFVVKLKDWAMSSQNKTITSWIIEQLHVQPYQHILEIGYGSGNTLYEAAKKLQVGFLAGVDNSVNSYQQSYRRNKKFILQQLMQLHLGTIEGLPYPAHYFHSVYVGNIYRSWKEPEYKFMQINNLLKSGGKLVAVFQPREAITENETWQAAEKIQQQYIDAGFIDVRVSFRDMHPASAIAVVGNKE